MMLFSYKKKIYGDGYELPKEGNKITVHIPISVVFVILFLIGCFLGTVIFI